MRLFPIAKLFSVKLAILYLTIFGATSFAVFKGMTVDEVKPEVKSAEYITSTPIQSSTQPAVKSTQTYKPVPSPSPATMECRSKSGRSVNVKLGECETKYVDCQINKDWFPLLREDCNKIHDKNKSQYSYNYPTYTYSPLPATNPWYPYNNPEDWYKNLYGNGGNSASTTQETNQPKQMDYTSYCKQELDAHVNNALAIYGTSSSTFFALQDIYHKNNYPSCLSTGVWPNDSIVSEPKSSPNYEGTQVYP